VPTGGGPRSTTDRRVRRGDRDRPIQGRHGGGCASVTHAPIGIAVVGCGTISAQHLAAIAAVEGARMVGVVSAHAERARAVGEAHGVPWTTALDDLLAQDDVDAVAICTPSGLHAEQALAALRTGRHVLVEKPLALSVADADRLVSSGRQRARVVATVSQRRFEPIMQAVRQAVVAGAFGRIAVISAAGRYHRAQSYYDSAAWRGTRDLDGGVLMNQAIHLVDLMCWFGGPVLSVSGQVATLAHAMEAEDTATVGMRFASGALGEIIATTTLRLEHPPELSIHGTAGHVRIVAEEAVEWDLLTPPPASVHGIDPHGRDAVAGSPLASADYVRQYTDFVAAIRDRRPPYVTGDDGRRAVQVVTAAYESDRTGRAVPLETPAR